MGGTMEPASKAEEKGTSQTMTKRWSSTVSEPLKTKRRAAKDVRAEARREHNRLMREDPHYRDNYESFKETMDTISPNGEGVRKE